MEVITTFSSYEDSDSSESDVEYQNNDDLEFVL